MDVILKLELKETREFFAAFFNLSDYYWQVREPLPLWDLDEDLSLARASRHHDPVL